MEENKVFCRVVVVRDHGANANSAMNVRPLTRKTIESVLPFKLWTYFLSLISASELYSFQYVSDVSPYLGALITLSQK